MSDSLQKTNQTKDAIEARKNQAKKKDNILEVVIKENPGLTGVEIEKIFKQNHFRFESSYLKNALERLLEQKRIEVKLSTNKEGKVVKRYYFKYTDTKAITTPGIIEIPIELIDLNEWKQSCIVYALKNNEIVLSIKKDSHLEEMSFFTQEASVRTKDDSLFISLPLRLVNYYELDNDNYEYTIGKCRITLKIFPRIVLSTERPSPIKNILLLEDDDYWNEEFTKALRMAGYTVFNPKTLDDAKRIAEHKVVDFFLLDWEIKAKKIAVDFFIGLKKRNEKIHGSLLTAYTLTDKQRQRFTKLGFSSIVEKHRADESKRDISEVINEQIARIGMLYQ